MTKRHSTIFAGFVLALTMCSVPALLHADDPYSIINMPHKSDRTAARTMTYGKTDAENITQNKDAQHLGKVDSLTIDRSVYDRSAQANAPLIVVGANP